MTRKDLIRDISVCQQSDLPHIADVRRGIESGDVAFTYLSEALPDGYLNLQILIPEPSDYPESHQCLILIDDSGEVPQALTQALEHVQESSSGKSLIPLVSEIAKILNEVLAQGTRHEPSSSRNEQQAEAEEESDGEFAAFDNVDNEADDDDIFFPDAEPLCVPSRSHGPQGKTSSSRAHDAVHSTRLRADLCAAKRAGFKVGVLGSLSARCILCISIRVVKLGISDEAMRAWSLQSSHYLVLMIRFRNGYRTLEDVSELNSLGDAVEMRVVLCRNYKPKAEDAFDAFENSRFSSRRGSVDDGTPSSTASSRLYTRENASVEPVFIAGPLNSLLRDRFPVIVRFRLSTLVPWHGAEQYIEEMQGKFHDRSEVMDNKYYQPESYNRVLSPVVAADSLAEAPSNPSLPLVAMQFVLRHFVRCTEFCLICHCRIDNTFEALKPYVCSKPLCLYQYLNLGFGPSIEYEILSQPHVVDLLVSFCYVSARQSRLKDFPVGLDLTVPLLQSGNEATTTKSHKFTATYDTKKSSIRFDQQRDAVCPVKVGQYIVFSSKGSTVYAHTRVESTSCYPLVSIGPQTLARKFANISDSRAATGMDNFSTESVPNEAEIEVSLYNHNFADLSSDEKRKCIAQLLDTLPSVIEIRHHLLKQDQVIHPTLKGFILPPVLSLLQWVIASNRSCIMQIDQILPHHSDTDAHRLATSSAIPEDYVRGMKSWLQFRFASGAPDKEQRFVDSVSSTCPDQNYPTLFAWHGSPLANWHSIIREGLHFKDTVHGRSYGHGIYMSRDLRTSLNYSGHSVVQHGTIANASLWPNSVLEIHTALSLQEVVNKTSQFVNSSPHYVVQHLDWVQTRYLFVQGGKTNLITDQARSATKVADDKDCIQDPVVAVSGEGGILKIPITAISKNRRPTMATGSDSQSSSKKVKHQASMDAKAAQDQEDDANSVLSDPEDRQLLEDPNDADTEMTDCEGDEVFHTPRSSVKRTLSGQAVTTSNVQSSTTMFRPGALDLTKLKMLQPPKDASPLTTRSLMKALKETMKVQENTPLQELGWYINRDLITNMYQWIVELHSFDKSLPLAKDMTDKGITSIVLELRFTNSFPFSPPFARIIQPRFLAFLAGGGGHVTNGGAICMELLTNTGWLLTSTIESVLLQIRMALSDEERPARLEIQGRSQSLSSSYGTHEAMEAYKRACRAHGWKIPDDFNTLAENDKP